MVELSSNWGFSACARIRRAQTALGQGARTAHWGASSYGGELCREKQVLLAAGKDSSAGIAREPREREVDNIVYFLFLLPLEEQPVP